MSYEFNDKELRKRLEAAQQRLDDLVATDSSRYIPRETGILRNSARYKTTPGQVEWAQPYAHYQYIGKDMIGVVTKRHRAMKDEAKEYNGKLLTYSEPEATPEWVETAKNIHMKEWVNTIGEILNGTK